MASIVLAHIVMPDKQCRNDGYLDGDEAHGFDEVVLPIEERECAKVEHDRKLDDAETGETLEERIVLQQVHCGR